MSEKTPHPTYEMIWEIARTVPYGRVTTYGTIAEYLNLGGARQVGYAMHRAIAADPPVPAHRVVNRVGVLTGAHQFPSPTMMQELLESEGVTVVANKVVDFEARFWKPE